MERQNVVRIVEMAAVSLLVAFILPFACSRSRPRTNTIPDPTPAPAPTPDTSAAQEEAERARHETELNARLAARESVVHTAFKSQHPAFWRSPVKSIRAASRQ